MDESKSAFKMLKDKHTGKTPLGRPRRRGEENIIMELKEIGFSSGNRFDLVQDIDYWRALVNPALNLWVPYAMELVIPKL